MRHEKPELLFFADDQISPNNRLPVLFYKSIFRKEGELTEEMKSTFASNNWSNYYYGKIISARHYSNSTHEVVGVSEGEALLELGGIRGSKIKVDKGDVLVIPAGVALRAIRSSGCKAIRACPKGRTLNLIHAKRDTYENAKIEIANIPLPNTDPIFGTEGGISEIWRIIF